MNIAWCPKHRGVMRIAFFDPPPKHFKDPCPRCGENLVYQIRNKYAMETPKEINQDLKEIDQEIEYNSPDEKIHYEDCSRYNWHDPEALCDGRKCHPSDEVDPDFVFPDEVVTPAPRSLNYCYECDHYWFKDDKEYHSMECSQYFMRKRG